MTRPETTAKVLYRIAWLRHIPAIAWVCGIIFAGLGIYFREPAARMRATKDLTAGHQVKSDDVHNEVTDAVVGHFLLHPVKAEEEIDQTMVTNGSPPHTPENSLAVRIEIAASALDAKKLGRGSAVVLTRGGRLLSPDGRVADTDCDERYCRVVVTFAKAASLAIDPKDLAGVEITSATAATAPGPTKPEKP